MGGSRKGVGGKTEGREWGLEGGEAEGVQKRTENGETGEERGPSLGHGHMHFPNAG